MKSTLKITGIAGLLTIFIFSFIAKPESTPAEVDEVKKVVFESYVNGAFNELDTESMEKGFHKEFAIFSAKGEELGKYAIADWVAGAKKRKANGYDSNDPKNVWEHKFTNIDVTGGAATVKVELRNQGKHVFTDYLSLLKFDSGWKIVAKVYHKH